MTLSFSFSLFFLAFALCANRPRKIWIDRQKKYNHSFILPAS